MKKVAYTECFQHVTGSHHLQASVIFSCQNLFLANPEFRSMSLNSHYIFLTKNARDKRQIFTFAQQFSPFKVGYVVESYLHATRMPYGYLLIGETYLEEFFEYK